MSGGGGDATTRHTDLILNEVIETEANFVADLAFVCDELMPLLRGKLSEAEFAAVFGNMEQLRAFHSRLSALLSSTQGDSAANVKQFFVALSKDLEPLYREYVLNYQLQSHSLVVKKFDFEPLALSGSKGLTLHSFIKKPVGRFFKYGLLVKMCAKEFPDDEEWQAIVTALNSTINTVNDCVAQTR